VSLKNLTKRQGYDLFSDNIYAAYCGSYGSEKYKCVKKKKKEEKRRKKCVSRK
jgi:hypothetical protein